jgi:hypothetical protein
MAYSEQYKRILYRLGYYDYQHGLIHRHLNQDEGWNSHLNRCRNYIINAVREMKPGKVTVLGSGWLLDLPLSEILETVNSVTLIDIVHPPEAKSQVAALPGVEIIEDDATGGVVSWVWEKTRKTSFFMKPKTIGDLDIPEFVMNGDPGLVISLNLLSQLDVLPVEFLRKRTRIKEEEIQRFRKLIQENHLKFLSGHTSLMISDICEIFTDSSGKTSEEKTVIADIPSGARREEWTWNFDLKGSDYYEKKSVLKVIALAFQI